VEPVDQEAASTLGLLARMSGSASRDAYLHPGLGAAGMREEHTRSTNR
jgi:hypothetical protein